MTRGKSEVTKSESTRKFPFQVPLLENRVVGKSHELLEAACAAFSCAPPTSRPVR